MANSRYQTTWEEFAPGNTVSHIYGMYPSYFLSAYTLGVRVDGLPAAKKLLIEPRPGDLTFAAGKVVTELGIIPISWKRHLGGLEVTCTIPLGSTATLRLPRLDTTLPPSATLNGQRITSIVTDGRYIVVPVAAGTHILAISSDLTWQGGGTNLWNSSTSNWLDVTTAPTVFRPSVNVIFDDRGSNSSAISLVGVTKPSGVTVDSTKNFTLAGPGSLSGSMRLTKAGSGSLTLASTHSYSGGVALDGGILSVASSGSLGSGPVTFNGGRLAFTADSI
jgi:autotransporter-associated beta strand protein